MPERSAPEQSVLKQSVLKQSVPKQSALIMPLETDFHQAIEAILGRHGRDREERFPVGQDPTAKCYAITRRLSTSVLKRQQMGCPCSTRSFVHPGKMGVRSARLSHSPVTCFHDRLPLSLIPTRWSDVD